MSDETVNETAISVEGAVETMPTETQVNAPDATPADAAIGALATTNEEAASDDSATASDTTDAPAAADAAPSEPVVDTSLTPPADIVKAAAPAPAQGSGQRVGNQSIATDPANDVNIIRFDGEGVDTVRGRRKVRVGKVVSNKMMQTVVVAVESRVRHPLYGKFMRRTAKFKAHDEKNDCGEGDTVEIMETRPISKEKCWRVVRILEKAK